eukprot:scaffold130288_cov41-Attheya_sp.AAC.1
MGRAARRMDKVFGSDLDEGREISYTIGGVDGDYGCKHSIIEQHLGQTGTSADVNPSLLGACKSACPTCLPTTAYEH